MIIEVTVVGGGIILRGGSNVLAHSFILNRSVNRNVIFLTVSSYKTEKL